MIVDSFNQLAFDFMSELIAIFPEEELLKEWQSKIQPGEKLAIEVLLSVVGDKSPMISAKDETIFKVIKIPGISIRKMWKTLPEETKDDIWQRLNAMMLVGTTMNNTPPELMAGIEDLAIEFGEKLQKGELDMSSMMGEILSRVQTLDLSSLQNMNMDIGALTSSLGIDQNELNNMVGGMLGGVNPDLMKTMTGLMLDQGGEEDILSILESARPPPRNTGVPSLPDRSGRPGRSHRSGDRSESSKKKHRKH